MIEFFPPLNLRLIRVTGLTVPPELSKHQAHLCDYIKDNNLSMTPQARLFATTMAARYVIENDIDGDFVECGVWRGGHAMLLASAVKEFGGAKNTYLFDTFSGMSTPSQSDYRFNDSVNAQEKYDLLKTESHVDWVYASIEEVRENFLSIDLLDESIKFIKGDVEDTLMEEGNLPEKISILRLDTDFYESTKLELEVLYPRLTVGGVLIVDDYGLWAGSKKAVDEYFERCDRPFFHCTDIDSRIAIKR